jgi:putative acetyltransferase
MLEKSCSGVVNKRLAICLDGYLDETGFVGFTNGPYRQHKTRQRMTITLDRERPDTAAAQALIEELEGVLEPLYPTESRHGYSVEKLLREGVNFFVMRIDGEAAACGGIQFFGTAYGELKRMYVRPRFRGMGLGKRLLVHLQELARERGVETLRLETGIYQTEAIGLYEGFGFRRIRPFGAYEEDPLSFFYEKKTADQ